MKYIYIESLLGQSSPSRELGVEEYTKHRYSGEILTDGQRIVEQCTGEHDVHHVANHVHRAEEERTVHLDHVVDHQLPCQEREEIYRNTHTHTHTHTHRHRDREAEHEQPRVREIESERCQKSTREEHQYMPSGMK
jgi:hypothetical protein